MTSNVGARMKEIKQILENEITLGLINWDKLEKKIHAALNFVDNKFDVVRDDGGEAKQMRLKDAITFKYDVCRAIMLIKPRFQNGKLMCTGINRGLYDLKGMPAFPNQPEFF